jgi:hypothetical protein
VTSKSFVGIFASTTEELDRYLNSTIKANPSAKVFWRDRRVETEDSILVFHRLSSQADYHNFCGSQFSEVVILPGVPLELSSLALCRQRRRAHFE